MNKPHMTSTMPTHLEKAPNVSLIMLGLHRIHRNIHYYYTPFRNVQ